MFASEFGCAFANHETQLIAHSVATYALSFDGFPKRELDTEMNAYGKTMKYHGPKLIL